MALVFRLNSVGFFIDLSLLLPARAGRAATLILNIASNQTRIDCTMNIPLKELRLQPRDNKEKIQRKTVLQHTVIPGTPCLLFQTPHLMIFEKTIKYMGELTDIQQNFEHLAKDSHEEISC